MARIGLALSGGGVRGFAHLGLLQALEEWGMPPHAISGVSSGAIVGAFYAAGHKPEAILAFMKGHSYFGWSNLLLRKDGFFSMEPLLETLRKHIPVDAFEQLAIPLTVTATDFSRNQSVTFSKGQLFQAILASSSVPVIFEPISLNGSLLMDGGLLNNFPIEPLEGNCDILIGSHVNPIPIDGGSARRVGKANIIERCFHMAIAGAVGAKAHRCHLFIEPPLHSFNMFDPGTAEPIFEIGYKAALQYKNELFGLLA